MSAYWDERYATHCRSEARELFATSAASCVCDAILVALPIPIIWQLQMSRRKKTQAIALLSVGFIATASSCVRTYYVWRMFHSSMDTSWNAYPIYFTTDLEIVLGIVRPSSSCGNYRDGLLICPLPRSAHARRISSHLPNDGSLAKVRSMGGRWWCSASRSSSQRRVLMSSPSISSLKPRHEDDMLAS